MADFQKTVEIQMKPYLPSWEEMSPGEKVDIIKAQLDEFIEQTLEFNKSILKRIEALEKETK